MKPTLSIVVVSYRRHDDLVLCLGDLTAQTTGAAFEVILVLQAYPPGAADQVRAAFADHLTLHVLEYPMGLGVHGARNAALPDVKGEIVAFLDDDVRLRPDWVATLLPYYEDPSVGGVGGFVRNPNSHRLSARLLRPVLGMASRRYRVDWGGFHTMPFSTHPEADQPADWLSGGNMSFRRTALAAAGPFDEAFGNYGYDDVDIGVRVRAAGWRLLSTRRLEVVHNPSPINRPGLADLVREEEARRVLFVRKAIGHRRGWRLRYIARFVLHLPGAFTQAVARRCPSAIFSAINGARRGLAQYG